MRQSNRLTFLGKGTTVSPMRVKSAIYKGLRISNDVHAVSRAFDTTSPTPIVRRVGRRFYGRMAGRLARKLFG